MPEKPLLLIATTNTHKYTELCHALGDLPFTFIGLHDLSSLPREPEETEATIEGNALLKARYYGERTGYLTLSDDSGLFIDALNGWPGVISARIAQTAEERIATVLDRMAEFRHNERTATFRAATAIFDPEADTSFVAHGETRGTLRTAPSTAVHGFGYDPIFYVPELNKTFAELTLQEKESVSHRGRAVQKVKQYLTNQYGPKHVVVPLALIIRDGKILMNRRNDPHNPAYHRRWEFPGGGIEYGENIEEALVREVREECGYTVKIIAPVSSPAVERYERPHGLKIQIYLVPFVCTILAGNGQYRDAEVLETGWFDIDDVMSYELIGANAELYRKILPELKRIIRQYHL